MNNLTINDLLAKIVEYNNEEIEIIRKAYNYAEELPKGSTAIDFAYKIHSNIGNTMVSAIVNDKPVEADYVLQNKDRVRIITDILSYGPREEWLDKVKTTKAKRKINEFRKKEA